MAIWRARRAHSACFGRPPGWQCLACRVRPLQDLEIQDKTILNACAGEEAGVKSVEMVVHGRFAYGYLASEKGTHRLVRKSPFNAKAARQTSFAAVEVMPVLGEVPDLPPSALCRNASLLQAALSCCHGVMRALACPASDELTSALRLTAPTPAYLPALCNVNSWSCTAET